jgi:hypothetical protein
MTLRRPSDRPIPRKLLETFLLQLRDCLPNNPAVLFDGLLFEIGDTSIFISSRA